MGYATNTLWLLYNTCACMWFSTSCWQGDKSAYLAKHTRTYAEMQVTVNPWWRPSFKTSALKLPFSNQFWGPEELTHYVLWATPLLGQQGTWFILRNYGKTKYIWRVFRPKYSQKKQGYCLQKLAKIPHSHKVYKSVITLSPEVRLQRREVRSKEIEMQEDEHRKKKKIP